MKISTIKLQNLVTKATKGAGFNKLLPITSMIGIKVESDTIKLCTSDGTNYLYVEDSVDLYVGDEDIDFDVTVDADIFAKLVSKMTSENIKLEVVDDILVVSGNGVYKIALAMGEDGEPIHYPDMFSDVTSETLLGAITPATVEIMLSTIKPTLATTLSSPVYTNYLVSDYIISTDRTMLNAYKNPNKFDEDKLFSREFVDLLGLATDNITISEVDNAILAISGNMKIYSKSSMSPTEFNKAGSQKMIDLTYDSYCKLKKSDLLPLIERIALFVDEYSESVIRLNFTESGLEVTSNNDSSVELIEYMESRDFKPTSIKIDVNKLATQLKAYKSDSIDLYYGNPSCIKLVDGDIIQITALFT